VAEVVDGEGIGPGEGLKETEAVADGVTAGGAAAGAVVFLLSPQADIEPAIRAAPSATTIFFTPANVNGVACRQP
jgi:hypothetical protein